MLDLVSHPVLDKAALLGGCLRLSVTVDIARLVTEVDALPASLWGTRGGRIGVHRAAEAIWLRGCAPAEGERPIEDRPPLDELPAVRRMLSRLGGEPQRCLLARLTPGAVIPLHRDQAPYFHKTIRIHVPVATHDAAWMVCAGLVYRMRAGELWALNNSAPHAVWNAHDTLARTHLICDFVPDAPFRELLARGERGLGVADEALLRRVSVPVS